MEKPGTPVGGGSPQPFSTSLMPREGVRWVGWALGGGSRQASLGARREREGKLGEPRSVGIGSVARGPGCLPIKVGLQVCLPGQGRLRLS